MLGIEVCFNVLLVCVQCTHTMCSVLECARCVLDGFSVCTRCVFVFAWREFSAFSVNS